MNEQFQSWFSQGKTVEALCGLGSFFTPDTTYREEHDFVLAVGELLEWARQGHREEAAKALNAATTTLLDSGKFEQALRLLRSYFVLEKETQASLPLDKSLLAPRFGQAVRQAAERLSRDEGLRNLLLLVSRDFPTLRKAVGLNEK
jgi:hypothetical protein